MNKYEILYIIASQTAEETRDKIIARFEELVKTSGTVEKIDKWGVKKLAYPINYKNEGFYVLMNYSAPAELPAELERQMRNTEEVVRFMNLRKDA